MDKVGIVAFAFGVPSNIQSNLLIARLASKAAFMYKAAVVYTQSDIRLWPKPKVEGRHFGDLPGDPPPTIRLARWAVARAQEDGVDHLWVVAAQPHIWRCERDLKYAVRELGVQIEIQVFQEIEEYSEKSWFCSDSTQERTRSAENWWKREEILTLLPMFIYKLVAS